MFSILNISIVLYQPDWTELKQLLNGLLQVRLLHRIYLIDNSPQKTDSLPDLDKKIIYLYPGKNLGYGTGHNIALRESIYDDMAIHLVMNSDISVHADDIDKLCQHMLSHHEIGMLAPRILYPDGRVQHVCKLLPTPFDVFGRRFLPSKWMKKRNERYELIASGYDKTMNVPYLSGCFMLLRVEAVQKVRLFDERFFMYPEDIDLTRRIHRDYLTLYCPQISIIHHHEQASYHNLKMLWIHTINMCRYFNKWGWFIDRERCLMNQLTLEQVALAK